MNIEYKVLQTKDNIEREQNVKILEHFIPQLQVTVTGRDTLWNCYIDQFRLPENATGLILIEDDIKLCKNFIERCESVVAERENDVISMFRICTPNTEAKVGYRSGSAFNCMPCNYFPKWFCDEAIKEGNLKGFEEWYWECEHVWSFPSDYYIRYLLMKLKKKYYAYFPHLVQHINYKSTLGSRPMNRITRFFIDDLETQNGKAD